MAVAFLPVFYSKHALNDVVTLAPVTRRARRVPARLRARLVARLGARRRGRSASRPRRSTRPGRCCCAVLVAAGLRVQRDRGELQAGARGPRARGRRLRWPCFALLNPYALLNPSEARGQISGQSAQADTAKLGQDDTYGWLYYLGTLTWGLGWLPLLAAVAGARARAAARLAHARCCSSPSPSASTSTWARRGASSAAGCCRSTRRCACSRATPRVVAADALRTRRGGRARRPRRCCCASQGAARERPRRPRARPRGHARARRCDWIDANVPARRAGSWSSRSCPPRGATRSSARSSRSSGRSRPTRSGCACATIARYRDRGYCWVVVGSHQKDRGLKAGLRSARRYYAALDAASEEHGHVLALRARAPTPWRFSYDSSFNYRPRAYERPGAGGRDPPPARLHPGG